MACSYSAPGRCHVGVVDGGFFCSCAGRRFAALVAALRMPTVQSTF